LPHDGQTPRTACDAPLPDLAALAAAALPAAEACLARACTAVRQLVGRDGRPVAAMLDAEQRAAHGLAWLATSVECLRQLQGWAAALQGTGQFGPCAALLLQIGFGSTLAALGGGIAMSRGELARPADLGLQAVELATGAAHTLIRQGNSTAARAALAALILLQQGGATVGCDGLDSDLAMIRDQFRRCADDRVAPFAHGWHLADQLIPAAPIGELAGLGVFGLTIPEACGDLGLQTALTDHLGVGGYRWPMAPANWHYPGETLVWPTVRTLVGARVAAQPIMPLVGPCCRHWQPGG